MAKRTTEKPKMYIVRKYIKAVNLKQAIREEPKTELHDCVVDSDWKESHLPEAIGFDNGIDQEEELED